MLKELPFVADNCKGIDISELGEVGKQLGAGFHSDVYEFLPNSSLYLDHQKPWVIKVPGKALHRIRGVGYRYEYKAELTRSKDILEEAHRRGICIPYPDIHIFGDDHLPVVIQERLMGGHPRLHDHNFKAVLEQIWRWNQQMKEEFGAQIDLYHFAANILKEGPSENVPLDGFMYAHENATLPSLIDLQLIKVYKEDQFLLKFVKQCASTFDDKVMDAIWQNLLPIFDR